MIPKKLTPYQRHLCTIYMTAIKVYPMLYSILKETPYSIKDVKDMLDDPYNNFVKLGALYTLITNDVRQVIPNKEYILI